MAQFDLSKTKIISGLQCVKRLYLHVHQPQLAEISELSNRLITIGYGVQETARGLHPEGELIGHEADLREALQQTRKFLQGEEDRVLFEPAIEHLRVAVRSDLLFRKRNRYRINEVKASTQVKSYHYNDVAIQQWVIEGAGFPVKSVILSHVDNQFVYQGDGDYRGLFKDVNVTDEAESLQEQVPQWVLDLHKVLAGPVPEIAMGPQCSDPFECEFRQYCGRGLHPQPEYPVTLLPNATGVVAKLLEKGYQDLRDVPESELSSARHKWIWRITRSGTPGLEPQAAKVLRELEHPRFYLDFETVQFAVPIWAGTRPYEQLPFQWSCHIETEGGETVHKEFLDSSGVSPLRAFAESLIATLGECGAIVVYGAFEATILQGLIARFPDLKVPLTKIRNRIRNLLTIARQHYYHRDMKGSWSLKSVLPTVAPDLNYENLGEVQDGGGAQAAYLEIIDPATGQERRAQLEKSLRDYCGRDTLALVRIVRTFEGRTA